MAFQGVDFLFNSAKLSVYLKHCGTAVSRSGELAPFQKSKSSMCLSVFICLFEFPQLKLGNLGFLLYVARRFHCYNAEVTVAALPEEVAPAVAAQRHLLQFSHHRKKREKSTVYLADESTPNLTHATLRANKNNIVFYDLSP